MAYRMTSMTLSDNHGQTSIEIFSMHFLYSCAGDKTSTVTAHCTRSLGGNIWASCCDKEETKNHPIMLQLAHTEW